MIFAVDNRVGGCCRIIVLTGYWCYFKCITQIRVHVVVAVAALCCKCIVAVGFSYANMICETRHDVRSVSYIRAQIVLW